jgi:AraC-like DNA-binding protein
VIDFMSSNARTVGDAFTYSARYFKLINTAVTLSIDASGDPITFEILDESGPEGVSRAYAEYCFAAFFLRIRATTGIAFPIEQIELTHRRPRDTTEHERVFGCPFVFGAGRNCMSIRRAAWDLPTTSAQAGLLELLAQHADLLLEKLPRGPSLVERVRKGISEGLRGGDPSLDGVATRLGMTPRTLQRHLQDLGHSFNAVFDDVRRGAAGLYLDQPEIAIAEVAYLLGFSDQSTFNRAFKRWYAMTPKQYRARAT